MIDRREILDPYPHGRAVSVDEVGLAAAVQEDYFETSASATGTSELSKTQIQVKPEA